jgi:hypothetical protein
LHSVDNHILYYKDPWDRSIAKEEEEGEEEEEEEEEEEQLCSANCS